MSCCAAVCLAALLAAAASRLGTWAHHSVVSEHIEYTFHEKPLRWNDAWMLCHSLGGSLAIVDSMKLAKLLVETQRRFPDQKQYEEMWTDGHFKGDGWAWMTTRNMIPEEAGPDGYPPWTKRRRRRDSPCHEEKKYHCLLLDVRAVQPRFYKQDCNTLRPVICESNAGPALELVDTFIGYARRYIVYNGSVTWDQAVTSCRGNHTHLAEPTELYEVKLLGHYLHSPHLGVKYAWLAARREEDWWEWLNTGEEFDLETQSDGFPPWCPDTEPMGECLLLDVTNRSSPCFLRSSCSERHSLVCERYDNTLSTHVLTRRGQEYLFTQEKLRWDLAEMVCGKKGAHLAVIEDRNTAKFITKAMSSVWQSLQIVWLGGRRLDNSTWKWLATGEELTTTVDEDTMFPPWLSAPVQPGLDCLSFDKATPKKAHFVQKKCTTEQGFVCQREEGSPVPARTIVSERMLMIGGSPETWNRAANSCKEVEGRLTCINYDEDDFEELISSHVSAPKSEEKLTFQGQAYLLYKKGVSWAEAVDTCRSRGLYLAIASNMDEASFFSQLTKEHHELWLGASLLGDTWEWEHTGQPIPGHADSSGFPPWAGATNDSSRACLAVDRDKHGSPQFVPTLCSHQHSFVCEKGGGDDSGAMFEEAVEVFGGRTYRFQSGRATWWSASEECRDAGASLAMPSDLDQAAFITRHGYHSPEPWVGGLMVGGEWVWAASNETLPQEGPSHWPSRSHRKGHHCLIVHGHQPTKPLLLGRPCNESRPFVCEKADSGTEPAEESEELGDRRLVFTEARVDFRGAEDACGTRGGRLVLVDTQEVLAAVRRQAAKFGGFWVGARTNEEGQMVWLHTGQKLNLSSLSGLLRNETGATLKHTTETPRYTTRSEASAWGDVIVRRNKRSASTGRDGVAGEPRDGDRSFSAVGKFLEALHRQHSDDCGPDSIHCAQSASESLEDGNKTKHFPHSDEFYNGKTLAKDDETSQMTHISTESPGTNSIRTVSNFSEQTKAMTVAPTPINITKRSSSTQGHADVEEYDTMAVLKPSPTTEYGATGSWTTEFGTGKEKPNMNHAEATSINVSSIYETEVTSTEEIRPKLDTGSKVHDTGSRDYATEDYIAKTPAHNLENFTKNHLSTTTMETITETYNANTDLGYVTDNVDEGRATKLVPEISFNTPHNVNPENKEFSPLSNQGKLTETAPTASGIIKTNLFEDFKVSTNSLGTDTKSGTHSFLTENLMSKLELTDKTVPRLPALHSENARSFDSASTSSQSILKSSMAVSRKEHVLQGESTGSSNTGSLQAMTDEVVNIRQASATMRLASTEDLPVTFPEKIVPSVTGRSTDLLKKSSEELPTESIQLKAAVVNNKTPVFLPTIFNTTSASPISPERETLTDSLQETLANLKTRPSDNGTVTKDVSGITQKKNVSFKGDSIIHSKILRSLGIKPPEFSEKFSNLPKLTPANLEKTNVTSLPPELYTFSIPGISNTTIVEDADAGSIAHSKSLESPITSYTAAMEMQMDQAKYTGTTDAVSLITSAKLQHDGGTSANKNEIVSSNTVSVGHSARPVGLSELSSVKTTVSNVVTTVTSTESAQPESATQESKTSFTSKPNIILKALGMSEDRPEANKTSERIFNVNRTDPKYLENAVTARTRTSGTVSLTDYDRPQKEVKLDSSGTDVSVTTLTDVSTDPSSRNIHEESTFIPEFRIDLNSDLDKPVRDAFSDTSESRPHSIITTTETSVSKSSDLSKQKISNLQNHLVENAASTIRPTAENEGSSKNSKLETVTAASIAHIEVYPTTLYPAGDGKLLIQPGMSATVLSKVVDQVELNTPASGTLPGRVVDSCLKIDSKQQMVETSCSTLQSFVCEINAKA